jgi:hypothetical protein
MKMKETKANVYEFEAYAVRVNVEGDIEEYAVNFLNIFNNVRENKELLKVKNYYDSNDVTVYCKPEFKDVTIKYLKMFGEIKSCEKVIAYQTEEPDYDIDEYADAILVSEFD